MLVGNSTAGAAAAAECDPAGSFGHAGLGVASFVSVAAAGRNASEVLDNVIVIFLPYHAGW